MVKKMAACLVSCGIICAVSSFNTLPPLNSFPPLSQQHPVLHTIILDAGHGGIDPGARGLISRESNIALGIVLKLGKALQKSFPGLKIVYTRTSDVLPGNTNDTRESLHARADMANRARGDLFISIHCNAVGQAGGSYVKKLVGQRTRVEYTGRKKHKKIISVPIYKSYWVKNMHKGTQTYIWAADRSGPKGSSINEENGEEGGENVKDSTNQLDLTSPEAKIRAQLYEKRYFGSSILLASLVEEQFRKAGRVSAGGVMQRNDKGIWVLQATAMPSILVETGFVTNKEEEKYLNSTKGQNEIVRNIVGALKRYKDQLE